MVLSHSRQIFLGFFLDARMESFPRGHVASFTAWNGVPRVLLYNNLKSALPERRGEAIRFHPTLLGFAGHYRYEPRPVAIARGNENVPDRAAADRNAPAPSALQSRYCRTHSNIVIPPGNGAKYTH